jgi:hypothetical protein
MPFNVKPAIGDNIFIIERVENGIAYGTNQIGKTAIFPAEWDAKTGKNIHTGGDKTPMEQWHIHPDHLPLVDWSQPVWTIHDHRAATVIATNFRFRDRDEDLVLLIPTNPGQWGDPSPLVRTHAGDYVKDPWRTQSASALKFENIPIEKVTILGHITPANVDTTGEANVRLVFENGQLKVPRISKHRYVYGLGGRN